MSACCRQNDWWQKVAAELNFSEARYSSIRFMGQHIMLSSHASAYSLNMKIYDVFIVWKMKINVSLDATHQGYTKTHLCEESLPKWQLRFCAATLRRLSTKSRLQSFILISSVNILTGNIWVYFLGLSMPEDLDFLGQQEQARAKIKFNWIHWANK